MLPAPFHPTPTQQLEILDALTDPTRSLRDVAQVHNTSTPALSAWLARPEIDDQLRALDTLTARRVRLAAATSLPPVIAIANQVLAAFIAEESALTPDPKTHAKRTDHKTDCRARSHALRAAGIIIRLAKFSLPQREAATPPRPRPTKQSEAAPAQPDLRALRTLLTQAAHDLPPDNQPSKPAPTRAAAQSASGTTPHAPAAAPSPSLPIHQPLEVPPSLDHLTALNSPAPISEFQSSKSPVNASAAPIAPAHRPLSRHQPPKHSGRASNLAALAGQASGP